MIGLRLTDEYGATWQVAGADAAGYVLARVDEHEAPIHASLSELAARFNVKVPVAPEPDESAGWEVLSRASAEAARVAVRGDGPTLPSPEDVFREVAEHGD